MNQFQLIVNNGLTQKEEGFFFRAAPFTVTIGSDIFNVSFTRVFKTEDYHPVIYQISHHDTVIFELEHPDYSPTLPPEVFESQFPSLPISSLLTALTKLSLIRDKEYASYKEKPVSFSVYQDVFLVSQDS